MDSLPDTHQDLLYKYKKHLKELKKCVETNHALISQIIQDVAYMFENSDMPQSEQQSVSMALLLFVIC